MRTLILIIFVMFIKLQYPEDITELFGNDMSRAVFSCLISFWCVFMDIFKK